MNPYVVQELAEERRRDAVRQASKAHLVALARCCRPSELARMLASLRSRLLGSAPTAACC